MKIKNIAIIAHVDHGKTTLVDALLKQCGAFRTNQQVDERVMDSNDLEKERGITILSKCTAIFYKDYKINVVDTPGHSDFGGEVERILGMVEGVVLLVDSQEGIMPQTRFVTSKALQMGIKPIVVVNKMDKPGRRPQEVINGIFDLFVNLEATDEQLDFPILYAAARDGWVSSKEEVLTDDVFALLESTINNVPDPKVNTTDFSLSVTMIESDPYLGRILIGKIHSGVIKIGDQLHALSLDGDIIEKARVNKLFTFDGINREAVEQASCGDIICVSGFTTATVSDTICSYEVVKPILVNPIDPPVLSVVVSVNDSPLAGLEGKKLTSRVVRERLLKEQDGNVSLKVQETSRADSFEVYGRGELQLSILVENMRREGFELSISKPQVLVKLDDNNQKLEPIEAVQIDLDQEFAGVIIEMLQKRRGILQEVDQALDNKQRLIFLVPTRGLIGFYNNFLTNTKGTGTISRTFASYQTWRGDIEQRGKGSLISSSSGKVMAYALFNLSDRGIFFVAPGDVVYPGMIVGEHNKSNDLEINPIKAKQLSNVRAAGKDENIILPPAKQMSLEDAISYIKDDELIEVTPKSIRLRKKFLDSNERKRVAKTL